MTDINSLAPGTWNVDPSHSSLSFIARHLMITKVRGTFSTFSGTITVPEDRTGASVTASADTASVSTGDAQRDGHVKSADFFDVENHPTMTFASTAVKPDGGDWVLAGDLTIKGITKPVEFELEFEGVNTDPWGNQKAAFTAKTEVNRKDWGLEWNVALETGGVLVSEKIKLELDIQAVKAA
jgi:polyisoprenoid-binding protein YceI